MKFIIYFSGLNSQQNTVDDYSTAARDEARQIRKTVTITKVDIDQAIQGTNYSSGKAIECVTVGDDGTKKDSAVNPTLPEVRQMIDDL